MAILFGGLEQDSYDRSYSDWELYKRLWRYFAVHKRQVWWVIAASSLGSLMIAARPVLIASGVELLERQSNVGVIVLVSGALLVSVMTVYFTNWIRRRMTSRAVGGVVAQLRKDAFDAALKRDLAFYDKNKSGKVVSRITSDTQELGTIVLITSDVVSQFVSVFVLLGVLLYLNVTLTLIVLALAPFLIAGSMFMRHYARIVTRDGARALALVNDNIQESVAGISVAKNFRQEAMIYEEFDQVNNTSYRVNLRRGFVLSTVFPALTLLTGIAVGMVVWLGARFVVAGVVSAATWYLFIQSVDLFWFPFIQISAFISQFQQGLSAVERIFALIDTENSVQQVDDKPAPPLSGQIEFRNVDFGYEAGNPVLQNFNLTIKPGEDVAFVGHTGAGKSTIAKLITRFYEFQAGDILIDGENIRSFDMQSYRSQLGIVPQQPFLFSGTVMENIRYGRPDATDEAVEAVARSIGGGEWIETLPNGLASDVGERGGALSMGQRQLVSLLRVLLQEPAIFILDEATASIDPFTEMQIQEVLNRILEKSTSILIAHRLSTVRSADRIIVLREGAIIEEGSHEHLMKQGGHYADLYDTYFRHQSLSYIEGARDRFCAEEMPQVGDD